MMTEKQKNTILKMRTEGTTCREIADHLGMTLGSVKMFVSRHNRHPRHNRADDRRADDNRADNNRADDRRCEQCGKLLSKGVAASRGGIVTQRFCSTKCKNAWWKAHPDKTEGDKQLTRTCATCGKTFTTYKDSKYCSRACYYASMRKQ